MSSIYLIARLYFYSKSDILTEILLVLLLGRGLLVPALFQDIAEPVNSGPLVLYGVVCFHRDFDSVLLKKGSTVSQCSGCAASPFGLPSVTKFGPWSPTIF